MRNWSVQVLVVFLLFSTFSFLFFQPLPATASPMQDGPIGFYLMNQEKLGLTADQISKLQAISMKFQKLKEVEKKRIHLIHMEGMQLLMQKDVNVTALKKDIDRVLQHKKNIMTARIEMLSDAHKILTDQQFAKVKKLLQQMMMGGNLHPISPPPVRH
jgi:Spy/CpxP family protein refolding chaperone